MPPTALQKAAPDATQPESELPQPTLTTIETARLILETATMAHLPEIMPLITDASVMQWTSQPPVQSDAVARSWLATRCLGRDVFNFCIREKVEMADEQSQRGQQLRGPLVGMIGTFHPPSCGYMILPACAGRGYATEALRAFIPAYFERVPSRADGSGDGGGAAAGTAHDVLEGYADTANGASHRVLEKCGFVKCETTVGDFENVMMGLRDTVAYRYARPGTTLAELRFGGTGEDGRVVETPPPEPPVQ